MADGTTTTSEVNSATATAAATSGSLLEQAVAATKQTDAAYAQDLVKNLVENAQQKIVSWDKNLLASINKAIKLLDTTIFQTASSCYACAGAAGVRRNLARPVLFSEQY